MSDVRGRLEAWIASHDDKGAYSPAVEDVRALLASIADETGTEPYAWAVEVLYDVFPERWERAYTVERLEQGEAIAENDPSHTYRFKPLYTHPAAPEPEPGGVEDNIFKLAAERLNTYAERDLSEGRYEEAHVSVEMAAALASRPEETEVWMHPENARQLRAGCYPNPGRWVTVSLWRDQFRDDAVPVYIASILPGPETPEGERHDPTEGGTE